MSLPRRMTDEIRLGSLGVGWWGGVLAKAAASIIGVKVVSCYARSPENREVFAEDHGCTPMPDLETFFTSGLDGVLIATPHTTHADLIGAAADSGLHVFVDKPLTLTMDDADLAIEAVRRAGVVLQVGHNRRRQPANRILKDMLERGELGSLLELTAVHHAPLLLNPSLPSWRRRREETPVGGMAALGVHQVDTLHYLGGRIARLAVSSRRTLPEGEVDDVTQVLFVFESGALGSLTTSMATGPVVDVSVFGTEGIARNVEDGASITVQRRGGFDQEQIEVPQLDTVADQLTEFSKAIRGRARPETGAEEGRSVVAVLEAIVRSADRGEWVDVTYT